MATIETLDAQNWESFLSASHCVLILGKSDCQACSDWSAELSEALANGELDESIAEQWRFGKLLIDQKGLLNFKKSNPWLADVDTLPYNVIYVNGDVTKKYGGGGLERLQTRLSRI